MANYGAGGFAVDGYGSAPLTKQPPEYYLALITRNYQYSPNFMRWMGVLVGLWDDITNCSASFDKEFSPSGARGAQLDIIGQIAGASRSVPFQPSNNVSPILDDETYRLLLIATFPRNLWDSTIDGLQGIWKLLFPGGTIDVQDNQDMTAAILLTGAFSSIIIDLIQQGMIVPRPAAVLYNYLIGTLPFFGTDLQSQFISGVDTGHMA